MFSRLTLPCRTILKAQSAASNQSLTRYSLFLCASNLRVARNYSIINKPTTATMSSTTTTTTTISGPEILRLFPDDVNPSIIGSGAATSNAGNDLEGYDEEQVRLMDELCIVIDSDDKPIGSGSKKTCP
jgi:hypothetical protein